MRVRRLQILILLLLLTIFSAEVHALQGSLLTLRNFRSYLDLSYEYQGQNSNSGSLQDTQEHEFEEMYYLDLDYALVRPTLLRGHVGLGLGLEQEVYRADRYGTDTSQGSEYEYDISGTFFERKSTNLRFYAGSREANVARRFAQNYDLTTDRHGAILNHQNRLLHFSFSASRYQSRTEGLVVDRESLIDTYKASAQHSVKPWSLSVAEISESSSRIDLQGTEQGDSDVDTLLYGLRNELTFRPRGYLLRLNSRYSYREDTGTRETLWKRWNENLNWRIGRALWWVTDFEKDSMDSRGHERRTTSGKTSLEHRLFESLVTRGFVEVRKQEFAAGEEEGTSGGLQVFYRKSLPQSRRLEFDLANSYGVTDRDLQGEELAIVDVAVVVGEDGTARLEHPDLVEGSILVRSADGLSIYSEGVDYTLRSLGQSTEILIPIGSLINLGDTLLVDYRIRVNPTIRFETLTFSGAARLVLWKNRLRLFANYAHSEQERLGGIDQVRELTTGRIYGGGFDIDQLPYTYGGRYRNYDSGFYQYQAVEGYFRYKERFGGNWGSLHLRNIYTFDRGEGRSAENTFTADAGIQRQLSRNMDFSSSAHYLRSDGDAQDRSSYGILVNWSARRGRTKMTASAGMDWQVCGNSRVREDYVRILVRRYF